MIIAFSITCHESADCVIDQIRNFTFFSSDSFFVIHVNSLSSEAYEYLCEFDYQSIGIHGDKVFINAMRIDTSKNKYTLHLAHLYNFYLLIEKGIKFDYFMLEASNSLFVKHGAKKHIEKYDLGIGLGPISGYWREKIIQHQSAYQFLKIKTGKQLSFPDLKLKGCHEGSFYKKEVAEKVFPLVKELDEFCSSNSDRPNYPTEELWFQICFYIVQMENEYKAGSTITYMPWDRNLIWDMATVKTTLLQDSLPSGKFLIKRIERDIQDPIRSLIKDHFKY